MLNEADKISVMRPGQDLFDPFFLRPRKSARHFCAFSAGIMPGARHRGGAD